MDKWLSYTIQEIKKYLPQVDEGRLTEAYEIAMDVYKKKIEARGALARGSDGVSPSLTAVTDFVSLPSETVDELLHFKPDEDTVIAAMLYDTVDAGYHDIGKFDDQFSGNVGQLLEGLRILKSIRVSADKEADKLDLFRKLFMVIAKDIRVLVIFLAVKVVQMGHLSNFPTSFQKSFAKDVIDIFVPIASRLGVYRYKVLLEDLAFKYLYPEDFEKMKDQMEKFGQKRKEFVEKISKILEQFYKEKGFKDVKVSGRLKGLYSSYDKIKRKGFDSLEDLYDVFAVRIVISTNEVSKLYEALGHLHSQWRPVPSRFKDYIAVPKPNGYQSLHTAVLGVSDGVETHPVEVQIRSSSMHEEAEYGVASHWLYKEGKGRVGAPQGSYSDWVTRLSGLHKEMELDVSVLESMQTDIFSDHIYVLTPRGDIKDLPKRATPLDFAYAVHTDVGHKCVLAKVNGKAVSLDAELETGDTVEIVTRKDGVPKLEWINLVKTSGAKVKIRAWFAAQNDQKHVKIGRDELNKVLVRFGKPILDPSLSLLKEFGGKKLNLDERQTLLREIGKGTQTASNIIKRIYTYEELFAGAKVERLKAEQKVARARKAAPDEAVRIEDNILVSGMKGVALKMAGCCLPSYADDIVGYVSSKAVVTIHKSNCKVVLRLNSDRFVDVEFKHAVRDTHKSLRVYKVKIRIEAHRRIGLLGDIGSRVAVHGVNISHHSTTSDTQAKIDVIEMILDIYDLDQFERVVSAIEKIDGVKRVTKE